MNVLEICMSPGYGGLEMYMAKVANFLSHSEHNVSILVKQGYFLDKRFAEQGLERNYLTIRSRHFPLLAAFRLAKFLDQQKIDLIHVHHGYDLFLCVLARVFAKRGKVVYTRQMNLTRYKNDIYHRFLYRHVDRYVVISQALHDDAVKYLPIEKEKVKLLYYGVPKPPLESTDCQAYFKEHGFVPDSTKIAIFGRIEAVKGQHLVVEAVTSLIREGSRLQAALIGHVMDKDYFDDLQNDIKNNHLEAAIKYLGFHTNPVSIMPCFDVVVLATRCETFGLVLPEAMRAGVCVIGTDCGGVPEIIQHGKTGLLFKPDDANDLARQLRHLVSDNDLRQRLAEAGKVDADARFSEEKHFERLMAIFGELSESAAKNS